MDVVFPSDKHEIVDTLFSTQCEFRRCVGFCKYHQVYVTSRQLKQKKCLSKECSQLIKKDHIFWLEREEKHSIKKEKRILEKQQELNYSQNLKKIAKKQKVKKYVCLTLTTKDKIGLRQNSLKGLSKEIIKIRAIKFDINFNIESVFSSLVRPVDLTVESDFEKKYGITQTDLKNAKVFVQVMKQFLRWIKNDDVEIYCWSLVDYQQLYDETCVKASDSIQFFDLYKKFIDLQLSLCNTIEANKNITLDDALKLFHLKDKYIVSKPCNMKIAYILKKMLHQEFYKFEMPFIHTYEDSYLSNNVYMNSMSSFIKPDFFNNFFTDDSKSNDNIDTKKAKEKINKQTNVFVKLFSKLFIFTKYEIPFNKYLEFSRKMREVNV